MSFLADLPAYVPVFIVLTLILALFVWDRFPYEAVAIAALVVLVLLGNIDAGEAFAGLGHPAVITVAAVLVISQALVNAGVVDTIARPLTAVKGGVMVQVMLFTAIVALLSAFMNNVGALALLMPVAIKLCKDRDVPPSKVLMPMAFGSLLGGLMTAIGTPPNLIVAQYRARIADQPFALFDYMPVGVVIALAGVAFLGVIGWRLLPKRDGELGDGIDFNVEGYRSEIRVPDDHAWVGKTLREAADLLGDNITLLTILRDEQRIPIQHRHVPLRAGDVLWVEAEADALKTLVEAEKLSLGGRGKDETDTLDAVDDVQLVECVVLPDGRINGQTASSLNLRWRYGINLLAVSRQGQSMKTRLSRVKITAGDVLIVEGERESLGEVLSVLGCLPLADRDLRIGNDRRVWAGVGLFGTAIAMSAFGWVPIHISFVACVLVMAGVSMISARDAYRAIDWPIILLLGAMIPVGTALETSGGAELIANTLGGWAGDLPPVWGLVAVLVITMTLSDIVNNAAAAVLMCPIAAGVAKTLEVSTDPFLMAVAIGASCAFLTPVGHQSNTLVMGPGGYRFRDYWPLGLPLQALVGGVAIVMILLIWPL
ncbi:SLC13 family permease [Polycyclovorans algicola]|uniref:SLC13 family permease n=1 Tax=Polycyclovorans algicola TaxID=616992 RepID=UPI000693B7F3|nr:SLC13 family permease [Polycyclovorans algicola]